MRVLTTRPQPDSASLAEALKAKGHEAVICPLMRIELSAEPPPIGADAAVLLFTSANGVRAAAAMALQPVHGVFVIGSATGQAAEAAGFAVAGVAEGNVESLARLVADDLPTDQLLMHVGGSDLAGDLKGELQRLGYTVARWSAYSAEAAIDMPSEGRDFLAGAPGAVALFSPRTAKLFGELVIKARLMAAASKHIALCLSPAVAATAASLPWREIRAAPRADQSALVALLD